MLHLLETPLFCTQREVPWDFEIFEENGIAVISVYGTIYKYFYMYGMNVYAHVLKNCFRTRTYGAS